MPHAGTASKSPAHSESSTARLTELPLPLLLLLLVAENVEDLRDLRRFETLCRATR